MGNIVSLNWITLTKDKVIQFLLIKNVLKGWSILAKVIEMKEVSWRRNKKEILSEVNWEVTKGEHWAVLGLNGSGKTTLLNMVNGYIWPTTGSVCVLEKPFGKTDIRELRKSIGWVSSALEERINGRHITQDIVVSGKYASLGIYEEPSGADYEQAIKVMEGMGCDHLKDRTYEKCSNGQKQKILIARALMASPDLLILDEPSSGLDFLAREELMARITELANEKNGPTIIFVTHHIEEVLPVFSHTLLVQDGRIFDQGNRKSVLTSTRLSQFFQKTIEVEWRSDRAWLTLLDT